MRALEFLGRASVIKKQINTTMRKIDLLRAMTQRVTSSMDAEVVSRTRDVTSNETAIIKLMEAEDKLTALQNEYAVIVEETMAMLNQIEDEYGESILSLKYLQGKQRNEICDELHLGRTQVNSHHDRAIDELEIILEKSGQYRSVPVTSGQFRS